MDLRERDAGQKELTERFGNSGASADDRGWFYYFRVTLD